MGESTISMGHVQVQVRKLLVKSLPEGNHHENHGLITINHHFPMVFLWFYQRLILALIRLFPTIFNDIDPQFRWLKSSWWQIQAQHMAMLFEATLSVA